MIRHIIGNVYNVEDTAITLDVSGIGYRIFVSRPHTFKLEDEVTLYTHHAVRETASDLYGFLTRDELEIFEILLTLPKIGPKSAAAILTQADLELITVAVTNDDPSHLTKLSGMGKKTAEKVVAGLKDIFAERNLGTRTGSATETADAAWQADAIDALISLGYPHSEARTAVQNLPADTASVNEAVTKALKIIDT